jgi:hypothetical protein
MYYVYVAEAMTADDQFLLLPSVLSSAIDHPS